MNLVCDQDLVAEVRARYEVFSIIIAGKQCNGTISTCDLYLKLKMNLENCSFEKKFIDQPMSGQRKKFESVRQVIIDIVQKSSESVIYATSSRHHDPRFVFMMPCLWSSFEFCQILWTETFSNKIIFAALRLPQSWACKMIIQYPRKTVHARIMMPLALPDVSF